MPSERLVIKIGRHETQECFRAARMGMWCQGRLSASIRSERPDETSEAAATRRRAGQIFNAQATRPAIGGEFKTLATNSEHAVRRSDSRHILCHEERSSRAEPENEFRDRRMTGVRKPHLEKR